MSQKEPPLTEIAQKKGWKLYDFKELWDYRDLFYFLVLRDIKVLYKQTVLGFLWAVIRPVFSMVVFSIIFGQLANIPSDNAPYPVFTFVALIPWIYFSTAVSSSTQSLVGNANMLSKVYFPRLIIPLTPVLAGLVDFVIAFAVLGIMMACYGIVPGWSILFLPYLIALMVLTASGIGMWLSALGIQYRDVRHAIGFAVQILLYAAPVVWPVSLIPGKYRIFYGLYPLAGVIEGFRSALLKTNAMPWDLVLVGTLSAVCLFVSGVGYFKRMEAVFADVA